MRIISRSSTVLLLLSLGGLAHATSQQPDHFIFEGKELTMCMAPILTAYFEKHPEREPDGEGYNTSLWRGYVATFAVTDGYLKVMEVDAYDGMVFDPEDTGGVIEEQWRSAIDHSFPDSDSRILDWYTGDLFILDVEEPVDKETDKTRYTLLRIAIVDGKQEQIDPVWTEYHGPASGRWCNAGWDGDEEGPTISSWCEVKSALSTECIVSD